MLRLLLEARQAAIGWEEERSADPLPKCTFPRQILMILQRLPRWDLLHALPTYPSLLRDVPT